MGFGDTLEANVLTEITNEDSGTTTLSDSDRVNIHNTWAKAAWRSACEYADTQDLSKVEEGNISSGAVTTENDAYWGLDHFDSDFKTALLQGNTLFPYYGMIPKPHASEGNDARSRIFVITTNKIFKFDTSNVVYFNSVKNSIKHYIASEFFTARGDAGDSTYSSNAVTNGQTTYNQGVD